MSSVFILSRILFVESLFIDLLEGLDFSVIRLRISSWTASSIFGVPEHRAKFVTYFNKIANSFRNAGPFIQGFEKGKATWGRLHHDNRASEEKCHLRI